MPDLPADVFTTADAVRLGATQRQLEWAVRSGRLHRLRRGVLCPTELWSDADPRRRVALLARAVALGHTSSRAFAFSHVTAAALHGLPVDRQERIWLTVPPPAKPRREGNVVQQVAPVPPAHVTMIDGLCCTTAARTVADCLRHLPPHDAVAVADAALHRRLLTPDDLARLVADHRWPRATAATGLLPLLDGRRESYLESRSAVVMHQYGLPKPRPQVRILDDRGRFVGRVDFAWLDHGVVGEADGMVKYAGDGAERAVADERQRQARLEALGLIVVRWTLRQLAGDPPLLVAQLREALAAGDARRFRGRVA